jgi:hypothetical protein
MKNILRGYLPEAITTGLYASSISAMLSISFSPNFHKDIITALLTITLFIILVIVDWNNRVIVPIYFPSDDRRTQTRFFNQYIKLLIEVFSIVLIVVLFQYFLKDDMASENTQSFYLLFGIYLLVCWIWNFLMILFMDKLNVFPLLMSVLKGDVFGMTDLDIYTYKFYRRIQARKRLSLRKCKKDTSTANNIDDINHFKNFINKWFINLSIDSSRIIALFIGNHILWANLTACLIFYFKTTHLLTISPIQYKYICYIIVGFLFLFIITFLFANFEKTWVKLIWGIPLIITINLLYILLPINHLMYFILIQQIIIDIFIGYVTRNNNHKKLQNEQH